MENHPLTFWQKHFWGRPIRFFSCLMLCSLLAIFISDLIGYHLLSHSASRNDLPAVTNIMISAVSCAIFLVSAIGLILSLIPWTLPLTKWLLRRWFFCAAVTATLMALIYAEEDWRGRRAWEHCRSNLEARGFDLKWENYIPPPVPDDQNFFKAPKMQEWFVGRGGTPPEIKAFSTNENTATVGSAKNSIVTEAQAREYLAGTDQLAPQFDLLRQALKRPYARMDGDYSNVENVPIPNFVDARAFARVLAQRAHCYYLLHQPDAALQQLTLIHDMCRMFQAAPTGKPMTLVSAMINVAIIGLYGDTIAEGFRMHVWQEPQLTALEQQLSDVKLTSLLGEAFSGERAYSVAAVEHYSALKLARMGVSISSQQTLHDRILDVQFLSLDFGPRGWLYQNMRFQATVEADCFEAVDSGNEIVNTKPLKEFPHIMDTACRHPFPYKLLAAIMVPNFNKAVETMAYKQNLANMALVACGLERYRLAHGSYPDSLDALTPQFIEKLPHDIVNGGPLIYRKTSDSFVLYSIGWNEKDDGGTVVLGKIGMPGAPNPDEGDWVWPNATKYDSW